MQQVVFMPGGLTTDIKSLEANGSTVASAQAGDIVGFTVTAPAKFVRFCSSIQFHVGFSLSMLVLCVAAFSVLLVHHNMLVIVKIVQWFNCNVYYASC